MTVLALAELRRRAEEYAATLKPGDEIHDFDQEHIEQFRHLLPDALARHGLRLNPSQEWQCGYPEWFHLHCRDAEPWRIEADDAEPETVEAPAMSIQELHDLDPDNRFQGRNQ